MGISKTEIFTDQQNEIALFAKAFGHPARVAILQHLFRHFQKALKPLYLQGFYCIFIVTKTPKMTYNVKKRGFQK